jgi:hypothetical protein
MAALNIASPARADARSRQPGHYRERLLEVIERKKKGKRITVPDDETQPAPVPRPPVQLFAYSSADRDSNSKPTNRSSPTTQAS